MTSMLHTKHTAEIFVSFLSNAPPHHCWISREQILSKAIKNYLIAVAVIIEQKKTVLQLPSSMVY